MLVREILLGVEPFPTIVTDRTIQQAAELMREHEVRAVPVVEADRLVGIITDWDIVLALAAGGADAASQPVAAVMTSDRLITVSGDATVAEANSLLQQHRVHHLPVIDGERYVGTICLGLEWSEEVMLTPPVRPTLTARRP